MTSDSPRALALVGMPGAGKTLCAHHLESRGFFQFRFGQIVEDEVVHRGWAVNPDNERTVRQELRAQEGMDAIARRALPHLHAALERHPSIIIDGLYSFSEYKTLRAEFGSQMAVVAVVSRRALRYQRLAERVVRPLTPAQAEQRDYDEIERIEKGGPIAIADYTLLNDTTREALLEHLEAVVAALALRP